MDHVQDIFAAFGGPSAIAGATGIPLQTVSDWRRKGQRIPHWRRPVVLQAARERGVILPNHCLEYLEGSA